MASVAIVGKKLAHDYIHHMHHRGSIHSFVAADQGQGHEGNIKSFRLALQKMEAAKPLIYLDNSVIGGYHDEIFTEDTRAFFRRIENGEFHVYYSDINDTELYLAPQHIQDVKSKIPSDCLTLVELDAESKKLGEHYIEEGILTIRSLNDAYHIAIASVNRLDLLVSWNFKHIVNYDKIRLFNASNRQLGYPEIDIRTPQELISYE